MMLAASLHVSASGFSQTVSFSGENVNVKTIFSAVKKQTGYVFFYDAELLRDVPPVSINVKNVSLDDFLKAGLQGTSLEYAIRNKTIFITKAPPVPSTLSKVMTFPVSGVVMDSAGTVLAGATILVKGSKQSVISDAQGRFTVNARAGDVLYVSYVGYQGSVIKVGTETTLQVRLRRISSALQEVAVISTGYQTISTERAAGSFSTVSADDMRGKLQTNIMDRLEGMAAGFTMYKGTPQIRGISTINGTSSPLYVVDGVPFEGSLSMLNPSEVASITLLKDASAASIYGARAANGVIVIITRNGKPGPVRISYNSTLKLTPLPDRGYQNLMSSEELVNFQEDMFARRSGDYASIDIRKSMNDVYQLLYERKAGNISEDELQAALDVYRRRDRYNQVRDELVRRNALLQQHNIAFSGGSGIHTYNLSANYMLSNPYERAQSSTQLGFNLKNTFNLTKWMKVDLGVLGSNRKSEFDNGFNGYSNLVGGKASYYMLRNEDGSPAQWYNSKSQYEIGRLNDLGLMDETYRPLDELSRQRSLTKSKYLNINIGGNFRIIDGLSLSLRYQSERTEEYIKQFYDKSAYPVKTQINDATAIQPDGKVINYIPTGGQVDETRGDANSYTLRAQLNYEQSFSNKHDVTVLAGAEQRKIVGSGTNVYKYGYDDYSLNYKPVDELALRQYVTGTEALNNQFRLTNPENGFYYTDDRFLSFYGNASYTFNRKITATGSIRMDQSNLFGTDPKYQYRPLWSAGLLYVISENQLPWLDRLAVRATYGINGNIAKKGGPFMIVQDISTSNFYTNESQARVSSPPNSGLRWEKTNVTNLALDFRVLNSRLSGSVEFYNKSTSDLLGDLTADPTLGWPSILVNYGSMFNRGVDVTLTSRNIVRKDLKWSTTLNFNYNKNELTKLENPVNTVTNYIYSAQNRIGKPMASLYSIRYAGLNASGMPEAYTADGKKVASTQALAVSDLVYNGTATPPYAASLLNTISYKGFDLFFMFIYYGGHVMRGATPAYLSKFPELNYTYNMDRNVLHYWQKPGDEQDPDMAPGYTDGLASTATNIWEAADKHMQRATYIKLRDVTLSYDLPAHLLHRTPVRNLRLSMQAQNLWRWAANDQGLDPEVWSGTTLSPSRGLLIPPTYTLGLSVNF